MATLSRLNIIWTVTPLSEPSSPSQVIVYDRGQVIESPSLIGRISFRSVPLSADIVLNSTRLSDAGTYRCVVNNPPEPAPPSSPLCLWDGRADEGGSISLSCSVEEGVPVPELRWDKLEPDQISLPVNKEANPTGQVPSELRADTCRAGLCPSELSSSLTSALKFLGEKRSWLGHGIRGCPLNLRVS
ncbi:UNVERIFIED_CONTAM: hypothetical protein FKN15_032163 [Acipenser sinensis]